MTRYISIAGKCRKCGKIADVAIPYNKFEEEMDKRKIGEEIPSLICEGCKKG